MAWTSFIKSSNGEKMEQKESQSSVEATEPIDDKSDRRLVFKIDFHLIPPLMILFLLAFIDRINIGNARIQGLEEDLNMTGNDYNIALFIFFPLYIVLEVPCNLILKNIRPSIWLPSIMLCWGIITVCQGVTKSFSGLVVCRLLLGAFEAGFFPGSVYLISMYYKRHELQWRINLFFSSSILAGSFSGLLAYAIAHMDGIGGYSGWRWIFILEGLATVVMAIIGYFWLPDWPETATFLTAAERERLIHRLAVDSGPGTMSHMDAKAAKLVFSDIKIYLAILMYIGIVNTGYSTSFFTPTILRQLGWTSLRAQVMSIPIYIVATVTTLIVALISDRLRLRYPFTILGLLVASVGYSVLLSMKHVPVSARYFALYAITTGGYITQPITVVWVSNNVAGHYKRGIAPAMQVGFGNCGGLIASNIYLKSQAPEYPLGFGLSLALLWLTGCACTAFFLLAVWENRRRDRGELDERVAGLTEEEERNLGDAHPSFRFTY